MGYFGLTNAARMFMMGFIKSDQEPRAVKRHRTTAAAEIARVTARVDRRALAAAASIADALDNAAAEIAGEDAWLPPAPAEPTEPTEEDWTGAEFDAQFSEDVFSGDQIIEICAETMDQDDERDDGAEVIDQ